MAVQWALGCSERWPGACSSRGEFEARKSSVLAQAGGCRACSAAGEVGEDDVRAVRRRLALAGALGARAAGAHFVGAGGAVCAGDADAAAAYWGGNSDEGWGQQAEAARSTCWAAH